MKIASTARDATVFVARIPLGAGKLVLKGIPSPVTRTVGKVIGTVDVLRPHLHVSTDAGAPAPEPEPAEAAPEDSPKPHGDPLRPDAAADEAAAAEEPEEADDRAGQADSPKPHGDPLRPVPSDTGASGDGEAADATDTAGTDTAGTAEVADTPSLADVVEAALAASDAHAVTAPADEVPTPADMPGAKNKPDTRPTAAQVAAEEQSEVTTPVGTTGADVAHNPDTAETDLQQPGTEPLLDPSTTKKVAKESEILSKAADSKKG